ncbi:MAG: hypothetical protein IPL18_14055 [Sphingomonadales bacterium]|nr:hypothetical protein [Sphingomonadales bacterium]
MIFSSEADRTQLRAGASFPRNGLFGRSIWDDQSPALSNSVLWLICA